MNLSIVLILFSLTLKGVLYPDTSLEKWIAVNLKYYEGKFEIKRAKNVKGDTLYVLPLIPDFTAWLEGSPGGNVWVLEFTQKRQRQSLFSHLRYGFWPVTAVKKWGFLIYDTTQFITPYELEKWNPYVFEKVELKGHGKVNTPFIIIPLSKKMPQPEVVCEVRKFIEKMHRENKVIVGWALWDFDTSLLKEWQIDILVGKSKGLKIDEFYIIPFDLTPLKLPDDNLSPFIRVSLRADYSFLKRKFESNTLRGLAVPEEDWPLSNKSLFGSFAGFPGRWFGHAALYIWEKWTKKYGVWNALKAALKGYRILNIPVQGFALYEQDPLSSVEVMKNPVAVLFEGKEYLPSVLRYFSDSLPYGDLPLGKPSIIIENFDDTLTLWGDSWKGGPFSMWKTGKFEGSCIYDSAITYNNLWASGQVLRVSNSYTGYDLSMYDAIKIEPVSTKERVKVMLISSYSNDGPQKVIMPSSRKCILELSPPYSYGVIGIDFSLVAPAINNTLCLGKVELIEGEEFREKFADAIFRHIEVARMIGDTSELLNIVKFLNNYIKLNNIKGTKLNYIAAYGVYRTVPLIEENRLNILKMGLEFLEGDSTIEGDILRFAILGYMSGLAPLQAFKYGKLMNTLKEKLLYSQNPRAFVVIGTSELFTPKIFGGDPKSSINRFEKAIELFINRNSWPHWGESDAYAFLYLALIKEKEYQKAERVLENGLKKHPEDSYLWFLKLKKNREY